jgi:hypothetical protein
MSVAMDMLETGPMLAGVAAPSRWVAPEQSGTPVEMDSALAERAKKMQNQTGGKSIQRTALLGVLLARLVGVPFEGMSQLLAVKPPRLEKYMHGESSIPAAVEPRWESLSQILDGLHSVIRPEATWRWMNTPIPSLNDMTPLASIQRGRTNAVLRVARSYRDPAFH